MFPVVVCICTLACCGSRGGGGASSSSKHHISSPLTGPPMRAGSLEELEAGGWNVEKRRERDKQGDITTSSLGLFP